MTPVIIGNATLYHADSLDWLAKAPECFKIEGALVTDPPYGLDNSTDKADYDTDHFEDNKPYLNSVCAPIIRRALEVVSRGAVSCGLPNVYIYPPADCIGAFIYPSAASWCNWGTPTVSPILLYGKRPPKKAGAIHRTVYSSDSTQNIGHPCPKPLTPWTWLVDRVTNEGDTVFDPFMGSGTTGVACHGLGLKFVGIEIEKRYFDIACERIDQAQRQLRMFA